MMSNIIKRNLEKRGQVALEYMLLIGLIIAVILPLFYYSFSTITQNTQMAKASTMVNTIVETADTLYALGSGSQELIVIEVPRGVENITIQGKEIIVKIRIFSGLSDVSAKSKTNMTGTLNKTRGSWHVLIKNENNTIQISNQY